MGDEAMSKGERDELARLVRRREKLAKADVDRVAEIERSSLEVQTELVAGGLRSAEARAFLAAMPSAEALLPALTVAEIEGAAAS